jgi:predicted Zn-dependent protease with MMP-like domain
MKCERFVRMGEEALDWLPREFRTRIRNLAVLVEALPSNQPSPQSGQQSVCFWVLFYGVPATKNSVFDLPTRPDRIVLYRGNIEAVCSSDAEVRHHALLLDLAFKQSTNLPGFLL